MNPGEAGCLPGGGGVPPVMAPEGGGNRADDQAGGDPLPGPLGNSMSRAPGGAEAGTHLLSDVFLQGGGVQGGC